MHDKLELKILALVAALLLIGVLTAGFMVFKIEKTSLYSITEASTGVTANIIVKDIERIMLEGRADFAKSYMESLQGVSGLDEIILLHHDGHLAFNPKSELTADADIMKKMLLTKAPVVQRADKKLIFFKPLENTDRCKGCHANDPAVLGAVKLSFSIAKEYDNSMRLIFIVILATIVACLIFSIILWAVIRKMVITPVKKLEDAAVKLSEGDLALRLDISSNDEIGRFSRAIHASLVSISGMLLRVREVSRRVNLVAEDVSRESRKVVEGTVLETETINNISASVEEMNAAISDISEGTDGLAATAEETAAATEEMVMSINQITHNTQEMSRAVETTSASIEQFSATIKEVAANSGELAAAADETQSAILEIAYAIKEVEQLAKESAILSDKVKKDAVGLGMVSVEKSILGMQNIKASVKKTADCISKLGGRSEEIGKILNVIDEVTDQTTMLALNAAILAAQAGEHGKGFSVVAEEIKDLAGRTSVSTQEIGELIQAVQQEVRDAVTAMNEGLDSVETGFKVTNEAVDALRKIVESSKRSSEMAAAIEHSTTEQSRAARLVSEAMERVLGMVGQIAKATNEQSNGMQLIMSATEKINDLASHIRTASAEQSHTSGQIFMAVEQVSEKSQHISNAIREQKIGSNQIWTSLEKIKDLPRENRERAFKLNQMVNELVKDAELAAIELEKFKLSTDGIEGRLRMGIVPLEAPAVMYKKFSPLVEYLGKRLQRKIELRVAIDFVGAVNDLGRGETQFCFMTPSTYVEAHKKYGASVIVKALRNGKPFQHSVIITREDTNIKDIKDLRNRSFAFGDINSTSSHIVPRGMLLSEGIDLKDLFYYNYLGHHDDIVKAVLAGEFDAGAVMESAANKHKAAGLRIVRVSDDIPEFNISVSGRLDTEVVSELRTALLALNDGSAESIDVLKAINESYTGFTESSDDDYSGIRTMMSRIALI
ncbi:MAG: phosphate/phosphite/phosphonate ABC transporter substrate-binding protein [Nitrospirae bacterium]|nr:phosphate/phosphite/phosphonate ABC transporter substrate-binding protein [Nitrospirota bacterium]